MCIYTRQNSIYSNILLELLTVKRSVKIKGENGAKLNRKLKVIGSRNLHGSGVNFKDFNIAAKTQRV